MQQQPEPQPGRRGSLGRTVLGVRCSRLSGGGTVFSGGGGLVGLVQLRLKLSDPGLGGLQVGGELRVGISGDRCRRGGCRIGTTGGGLPAELIVLVLQFSEGVFNEIEELVHLVLVVATLADRRLAECHVMNVSGSQRHR